MTDRADNYRQVRKRIRALIEGETDAIALMATVVCELFHGFELWHWVGFYRVVAPELLKIGPYQGGHGCLTISFDRGVCGKCAREGVTQVVPDVSSLPYHIACSSSTRSEIVVPVKDSRGTVQAVLDIDSDEVNLFDEVDRRELEAICEWLTPAISRPRR